MTPPPPSLSLFPLPFSLQILSKDSVTVFVDAVVYFNVYNPVMSVKNIADANRATRLLAQTTLRNILGAHTLSEILSSKQTIQAQMTVSGTQPHIVANATGP